MLFEGHLPDSDNGDNSDNNGDNGDNDSAKKSYDSQIQSQIQQLTSRLEQLELEVRGNFADKGLKDDIRQIDQWLDRHDKRFDVLSRNLEGLSCDITFPSTMGTKPRDTDYVEDTYPRVKGESPISSRTNTAVSSKQGDTVCNSYASYSASQVASEIGKSSRTVRDHLSKLSIGEVYKDKYKLVERKPYKLERIE
jgi:hypothetical protein